MMNVYIEAYQEYLDGNISDQCFNSLNSIMQESVYADGKKWKEKIKEIKKAKPSEYDGSSAIKQYVDKNYDNLIKCAEFIEKEPEKLRKNEITYTIAAVTSCIESYAVTVAALLAEGGVAIAGGIFAGVSWLITLFLAVVYPLIIYARKANDVKISDELCKVRAALKKCYEKIKNKDKETAKKIDDICTAIDDADTEISARVKAMKESVDSLKLAIYEKELAGEITVEERVELISALKNKVTKKELETDFLYSGIIYQGCNISYPKFNPDEEDSKEFDYKSNIKKDLSYLIKASSDINEKLSKENKLDFTLMDISYEISKDFKKHLFTLSYANKSFKENPHISNYTTIYVEISNGTYKVS
jgi:hypothetical protein